MPRPLVVSSLASTEKRYDHAMDAVFLPEGEGEDLAAGSTRITIKATGANTGGTFFLSESEIGPGFPGPPLHVHERLHDMFYVLDGVLTLRLADRCVEAPPGTFVCIPPGVAHTFSNPGNHPVRFLNFNTPSGWESYMRELAGAFASGEPVTSETIGTIAARYDFKIVA